MADVQLGQLAATLLREHIGKTADGISVNTPLLSVLSSKGNIKTHDGGREIARNIAYAENGNIMYYNGYQLLDTTPNDFIDASIYAWKQAAANMTFSGKEKRMTSGKNALVNLVKEKKDQTLRTFDNFLSAGVMSDGTGSGGLQVTGLLAAVADDPTTGTYGGINSATYTWWRNKVFDASSDGGAATSATNIVTYMNKLYNQLIRGNDRPDIILQDLNHFNFYEAWCQDKQRFTSESKGAVGFESYTFRPGTEVFLDNTANISASHTYMLNSDYLFWDVHSGANITPLDTRMPVNQDAEVVPVIWMGNLTCSNRALHGVIKE